MLKAYRSTPSDSCTTTFAVEQEDLYKKIINHKGLRKHIPLMQSMLEESFRKNFFEKVAKNVDDAIAICKATLSQASALWLVERKLRITGSICYSLYTYSKNKTPDWPKKIKSLYNGDFKGNEATRYGLKAEKFAKKLYGAKCSYFDCGLIISPDLPFLAVSPDGIARIGDEFKLVEIKCPVGGKISKSSDLLPSQPYLKLSVENKYTLNEKHKYYGQVQLSLAVTNLQMCDFVIYSSFANDFQVIKVQRNDEFIDHFIMVLTEIYFKRIAKEIFLINM